MQNDTATLQQNLATYCKTGENPPETSLPAHTKYYRKLVLHNIKQALKTAYPLARGLVGKERWRKMTRYFFENHPCETAQIWKMPLEFYAFYQQNPLPFKRVFPCLLEALHFEWLKVEVFTMEDLPAPAFQKKGSLNKNVLVPNPEIKLLALQYPVHLKNLKEITEADKRQYFVSIHRHFESKTLVFNDIAYPCVEFLLRLHEQASTAQDLLPLYEKHEPNSKKAKESVKNFIAFALDNGLLLGFGA
jgi:uncharacterized protein